MSIRKLRNMQEMENKAWENNVMKSVVVLMILFFLLIVIFFLGDYYNLADSLNIQLRFDWAANFCIFLSAFASIVLGSVAIVQNKRAEETNERLARITQDQLEASIIKDNYPLIKFRKDQRIESDNKTFILRFSDVRNTPLREVYTRKIEWLPFSGRYKAGPESGRVVLREKEKKDLLKFTYPHNGDNEGIYTISIPVENLFQNYRFARIELEMDLIGTTGVVTKSKAYVQLDRESKYNGMKERRYLSVYDQSFEIREIMSEQRYRQNIE